MRRRLILLDLLLLALVFGAGWRLRQNWREARRREQTVLRQAVRPLPPPPTAPLPPVEPVTAAGYNEVAQKMLFAPDRNPTVVVEAPKPKPMPPLPVAHGVMDLGDGPVVILSEKSDADHRAFRPGDKIGEFKVLAVTSEEIAFEWEGKEVKKRLEELREKKPTEGPAASVVAYERGASPTRAATSVTTTNVQGPGVDAGGGVRGCLPGDTSPPGTVVDGLRKIVTETPFGKVCRWEAVK